MCHFISNKKRRLFTGSSIMASGTDRSTTSFGILFDRSLGPLKEVEGERREKGTVLPERRKEE